MSTPKFATHTFADRTSIAQVEEGNTLASRFNESGQISVVTSDAATGEVLIMGVMTPNALRLPLATCEAHYLSRLRKCLWHKGATLGLVQRVVEIRIDNDQDAIWLRVEVAGGASCHVGYRLCFYPAEHWKHVRTSNPPYGDCEQSPTGQRIESTFATVRHRTKRTKGCLSRKTGLAMAFKLMMSAQKKWRKLDGQNLLPEIIHSGE